MTQTILLDGEKHEFPDDFTDADIQKALSSIPFPAATPTQTPVAPPSALDKFTMGLGDVQKGIGQTILHGGGLSDPYESIGDIQDRMESAQATAPVYDKQIAQRENDWQAQRAASGDKGVEWLRTAGNIAGTAPFMMALPASAPESFVGALGRGAINGLLNAGAQPVTHGDYATEKTKQNLLGMGSSAGLSGLGYGVGKIINPNMSPDVSLLQSKGVAPTPGQLAGGTGKSLEERLTSVPGLGDAITVGQGRAIKDFNRAAYQTALDPIGAKFEGEAGREGLSKVRDAISGAYDDILPNVAFKADGQFGADIQNAAREVAFAQPAIQEQFGNILKKEILPRIDSDGNMSGEAFKKLEEELSKQISKWSPQGGDQASLADAVDGVLGAFRGNLVRNNPQYGEQLQAANAAWARFSDLRRAVGNTRDADGVFTPNVLWTALRAGDKSAGKGVTAMAEGGDLQKLALAGLKVLGNKYPDSGTAGRASTAALLAAAPAVLGGVAHNPLLAVPAVAAGVGMIPYMSGSVQRGISNLFSNRSGQIAPLLGQGAASASPLLGGMTAGEIPSLLGGYAARERYKRPEGR